MNEEIARKIYFEVAELLEKFSAKEVAEKLSSGWKKYEKLSSDRHIRLRSKNYAYGQLVLLDSDFGKRVYVSWKPNIFTSF